MGNGHTWIGYLDGQILRHIDVYDGISNKNCNKDIDDFFGLTTQELLMKNRHRDFEQSAREAERILKEKRIRSGFKRTSELNIPGFKTTGINNSGGTGHNDVER